MLEANGTSPCTDNFGWREFDTTRVRSGYHAGCPRAGCSTPLVTVQFRKSPLPYCPEHGLRLHTGTFVYHNGLSREEKVTARLRNFRFNSDYVRKSVLDSPHKAESHRLGYEMSEDALSWNVFVGLLEGGALRPATEWLIGRPVRQDPYLYMWGSHIDLARGTFDTFQPLGAVRKAVERDIKRFPTEPDIMLVVPGELVVCIEAKFASGNPLAHNSAAEEGEKPKDMRGLLGRYLKGNEYLKGETIVESALIGSQLHSQLFRNVIFAASMTQAAGWRDAEWHVVNLVSERQWHGRPSSDKYSFADPTSAVRGYLAAAYKERFTFRSWEDLYRAIVRGDERLKKLAAYMENKSAHFSRAFDLL